MTRDQIIYLIFQGWCNREVGKRIEPPAVQDAIDTIVRQLDASPDQALVVEEQILAAMNESEENAFKNGFKLCLALIGGGAAEEQEENNQ